MWSYCSLLLMLIWTDFKISCPPNSVPNTYAVSPCNAFRWFFQWMFTKSNILFCKYSLNCICIVNYCLYFIQLYKSCKALHMFIPSISSNNAKRHMIHYDSLFFSISTLSTCIINFEKFGVGWHINKADSDDYVRF